MIDINGNTSRRQPVSGNIMATVLKGLSAYEIATQNGFNGTEVEWLQSLVGNSVIINVVENNKSAYVLSFTVGEDTFISPNLKPTLEKGVDYLTDDDMNEIISELSIILDDKYQKKGDYLFAKQALTNSELDDLLK